MTVELVVAAKICGTLAQNEIQDAGPTTCPTCDDAVKLDPHPSRRGWLWCPGCEWPVWMSDGSGGWIATPPPDTEEVETRFRTGIVRIAKTLIESDPEQEDLL